MRRRYEQYCGVARALDVVGERWTLLIVRELVPGPRRYSDLLAGLPGIGTGLLAARLKDLEAHELIVRRRLFPPASSVVYELTPAGRELEGVLDGLARWGSRWLGAPREREAIRPRWIMFAMRTRFDADAARGVRETYEFRLDGEAFQARVDDGDVSVFDGTAVAPDLVISGDVRAFLDAAADPSQVPGLLEAARISVAGSADALERCRTIFAPALPAAATEGAQRVSGAAKAA